jgi:hypothetical protein
MMLFMCSRVSLIVEISLPAASATECSCDSVFSAKYSLLDSVIPLFASILAICPNEPDLNGAGYLFLVTIGIILIVDDISVLEDSGLLK